jgi:hypothetical protein
MPTLRTTACLALLVAALSGWTHARVRKEMLRLQVRSASGSPVRVRLQARGLVIIPEHPTVARLPTTTDTTIVTPVTLTLGGVGEADIEAAASTEVLVIEAVQLRPNAPPTQQLTGRTFRVTHATYEEPYRVMQTESASSPRH